MVCKLNNCGGSVFALGLCSRHYNRLRITGTTEDGPKARGSLHDRLWAKIDRREPAECWPWIGENLTRGYGTIGRGGRGRGMILAHRAVWEDVHGPIPEKSSLAHGYVVMHLCDNRLCCNPDHLRLGTQAENVRDMDAKGRRVNRPRRGEAHHKAKLTEDDVRAIRASNDSQYVLAKRFGVSRPMIGYIKRGLSWRHIE